MNPETRVAIYQPRYFPQLHYFNRLLSSDIFVILDSAQYTRSLVHFSEDGRHRYPSYQTDTPIKLPDGEYLLTVPVKHDGRLPINQTGIDYSHRWIHKHLATLRHAYGRADCFEIVFPQIRELLLQPYDSLAQLNTATIIWSLAQLSGFRITSLTLEDLNNCLAETDYIRLKKVLTDQQTGVTRPAGEKKGTEWTAAICQALGATEYYHGGTAQTGYMEIDYYQRLGIRPVVQNWRCPEYPQQFSDRIGFKPNLSIVDLLMNVNPKQALPILVSA